MAKNIKKKLFGNIPVTLEPVTKPNVDYQLVKQGPPKELTKLELREGLITQLGILPSLYKVIPEAKNDLTDVEWGKSVPKTTLKLAFETSPLFDLYKNVISKFEGKLGAITDKDILK